MNKKRRQLIKLGIASIGVFSILKPAEASEKLLETDPQAISLGYKADTNRIDTLRWTSYRAGNNCANCAFFQGTGASGPCKVFGGKIVSAAGWCSVFKKA